MILILLCKTRNSFITCSIYQDPDKKKLIEIEVDDPEVKTGDILNIDERAENEANAKKLATAKLKKANDKKRTGNISIIGNPLMVAGQVIMIGISFGKYAGRYLIKTARHRFSRSSGYITEIEIKGI